MPRRAFVVLLGLLFVPLPAAAGDTTEGSLAEPAVQAEEAATRTLPLYLQAENSPGPDFAPIHALSSFVGDAITESRASSSLSGSTKPLTAPLVLDPEGGFRFVFPSVTRSGQYVNATIDVRAWDLLGRNVSLAHAEYRPPRISPVTDPQAFAEATLGDTALQAPPPPEVPTLLRDALDLFVGNALWNLLNTTYAQGPVCGQPTLLCGQLTAHYGTGQLRWCKQGPTTGVGATLYSTVRTADNTYRSTTASLPLPAPASSVSPCAAAFDLANESAATFGPTTPESPPLPTAPETNDTGYVGPDWADLSLDASAPAFLREDGMLVIPSGYRIAFEINATSSPALTGPVTGVRFDFGTAQAPARIELRTRSDSAFAMFAYEAESLGEGPHTGAYATTADVPRYFVTLAEGESLEVAGDQVMTLRDPDGISTSGLFVAGAGAPGRWTFAVTETTLNVPSAGFSFFVTVKGPGDDASTPRLAEGTTEGLLGDAQGASNYTVFAWRLQWVELTLRAPTQGEGDATLTFGPGVTDVSWATLEGGATRYSARASKTGAFNVSVVRAWGDFAYGLDLWTDPTGNLTSVPLLENVTTFGPGARLLGGFGGAVDVAVDGKVLRLAPGSLEELVVAGEIGSSIAHLAGGAPVLGISAQGAPRAATLVADGERTPIRTSGTGFAFGPDGRLYVAGPQGLHGVGPDRTERYIHLGFPPGDITFSPTGIAFVRNTSLNPAYAVDVLAGTVVPAGAHPQHFDQQGNSYRPHQPMFSPFIERVDPSGRPVAAAWLNYGSIMDITVSGTRVYALVRPNSVTSSSQLMFADLGVPMFEGFQPAWPPISPTADLVPAGFASEFKGVLVQPDGRAVILRDLSFTIDNRGEGAAQPSVAYVSSDCRLNAECDDLELDVPTIPAGGSVTLTVPWSGGGRVGEVPMTIRLDVRGNVTEVDETDNEAEYLAEGPVPSSTACEAALGRPNIEGLDVCYQGLV